jgi:branched-subunit amino acid ABC-type transport system permease component
MDAKAVIRMYFVTFLITAFMAAGFHIMLAFMPHPSGELNIVLVEFAQASVDMAEIIFGAFIGALSVCLQGHYGKKKDEETP